MATERIQIIVSENGSRTVVRNIQDIGTAAGNSASALDLLKNALVGLGIAATIRELIELADAFTNIQNRIRIVTDGVQQLTVVNQALYDIANKTRQSYEGTVETYTRVALSAKALGISQNDLLKFTENLNKAIALSGVNSQTATNGMIQLSQGMAAGRLQGQDLRAVLEDIPTVGDVIAEHFKVTRGELRQMGAEGKITAKDIIEAFTQGGQEINEKFGKTIPTISQGFTVLKNSVVEFVGQVATSSGATTALANALLAIAHNIDPIARSVGALAASFLLLGVVIPQVTNAIKLLTFAIASNPLGAIIVVITTTIALLAAFSDEISIGQGHLATLRDIAVATWEEIKSGLSSLASFFKENFGTLYTLASQLFSGLDLSIAGILQLYGRYLDTVIGLFRGAYNAVVAIWNGLPAAFESIFTSAMNGAIKLVESGVNTIIGAVNKVTSFAGAGSISQVSLGQLQQSTAASGSNLGKSIGDAFKQGFDYSGASDEINKILNRGDDIAQERAIENTERLRREAAARASLNNAGKGSPIPDEKTGKKTFADYLKNLQDEVTLLQQDERSREVLKAVLSVEEGLRRKLTDAEKQQLTVVAQHIQTLQDAQVFKDYNKQLDQEISLTNLNVRAKAEMQAQYQLEDQLKRKLTATEIALVKAKTDELLAAQDQKAINDVIVGLQTQNTLLQTNVKERTARATILQLETQLGRQLTPVEAAQITTLTQQNEALQRQAQLLQEINGPKEDLLQREQDLNVLFAQGKITLDQYNTSMRQLAVDLTATSNTLQGGILNGLAQIAARSNDLSKTVGDGIVSAFDDATDALVNFAKTGKLNVDSLFSDIAGQLLKLATNELFAELIGGFGGGSGPVHSGPQGSGAGGWAQTGVGLLGALGSLWGFAGGGSFTVGGSGGTDSQLAAFKVTPGERVTVQTPSQQQAASPAASVGVKIVNITDPMEAVNAMSSPEGEKVILNAITRNPNTVRQVIGARS
jgi:lambda family phage tail tape measure protein